MKSAKSRIKVPIIITLLAITAALVWWFFLRAPATPKEIIAVSGRIESDDSAVAAKVAGRIREIRVREGDEVKAGEIIALLDDDQIKAREEQSRATVQQAEAKLMQSQQEIAILQAQLEQSQLTVSQSRIDAEGRVSQAQADVAAAEASLAQARANYAQAAYDRDRFTALAESGVVSAREGRQSMNNADAQRAVVDAAERRVEAARGALRAAEAALHNPAIRTAQSAAIERQILQAQSAIAGAQADADRARAELEEAQANRRDLEVRAPFDATVATRTAEPGEVVAAGSPIVTLVDFNQVYLRGFVPEGDIGRVRVGQKARVYIDSNPTQPLEAVVSRIDPRASFTPENTYFRDDRVKQVVGVKLQLVSAQGYVKPGMPADGEVLVEGNEWVATNRK
jgi:HlyD family secretion protein